MIVRIVVANKHNRSNHCIAWHRHPKADMLDVLLNGPFDMQHDSAVWEITTIVETQFGPFRFIQKLLYILQASQSRHAGLWCCFVDLSIYDMGLRVGDDCNRGARLDTFSWDRSPPKLRFGVAAGALCLVSVMSKSMVVSHHAAASPYQPRKCPLRYRHPPDDAAPRQTHCRYVLRV
jgi:hypothetical protein